MINLLPPRKLADMRSAHANTVIRRYLELLIISVIILSIGFIAARYLLTTQAENTNKTLQINQAQIAKLAPVQKEAEQLSATVNTISSLLSRNIKFSEMLTQIGGVMPSGSVLTGLQFSIENLESPLIISAQVDNEQTAAVLRNNLAASDLFSRAEIKTITAIEEEPPSTAAPATSTGQSPYKYTTSINAYFKDATGKKK